MVDTGVITLEDLAGRLPSASGPLMAQAEDSSFAPQTEMPRGYVWPDLHFDSENPPWDAKVILVTAAGAMGKSVAAQALAHKLRAPRIDLSLLRVGSDSLTGLMTRVLGWSGASNLVNEVQEGQSAIVLDGIDEAQFSAGREHFAAFIRNVAAIVGAGDAAGQIVMFGRRDATDTAFLEFLENGVEASIVNISPLSYQKAIQLINLTLDGSQYGVRRTHVQPFDAFRDRVLLQIASALGGNGNRIDHVWPYVSERHQLLDA